MFKFEEIPKNISLDLFQKLSRISSQCGYSVKKSASASRGDPQKGIFLVIVFDVTCMPYPFMIVVAAFTVAGLENSDRHVSQVRNSMQALRAEASL